MALPVVTEKNVRAYALDIEPWENYGDVNWEKHGGVFVKNAPEIDEVEIIEFVNLGEYEKGLEGVAEVRHTFLPYSTIADSANDAGFLRPFGQENEPNKRRRSFTVIQGWNDYYGPDEIIMSGDITEAVDYIKSIIGE